MIKKGKGTENVECILIRCSLLTKVKVYLATTKLTQTATLMQNVYVSICTQRFNKSNNTNFIPFDT